MNFTDFLINYKNKYGYTNINLKEKCVIDISYDDLMRKLRRSHNYKIFDRNLKDISYCWMQEKKQKLDDISENEFNDIMLPKIKTNEKIDRRETIKPGHLWKVDINKILENRGDEFSKRRNTIDSWTRSKYSYNVIARRHTSNYSGY